MVKKYFCMSRSLGLEERNFTVWHRNEVRNTRANGIMDRDKRAELTRAEALELVNKWNGMNGRDGSGKYFIRA